MGRRLARRAALRRRGRRKRPRRGPVRRALAALVTTAYAVVAAVLLAVGLAPHLASLEWRIDLAAQFSSHAAAVTAVFLVWWAAGRRWVLGAIAAAALALHGSVLVPGRAAWASAEEVAGGGAVRVMQYNHYAKNRDAEGVMRLILTSDADVVALMQPTSPIVGLGIRQQALKGAYPYFDQHPRGGHHGYEFLLSKWPIREFAPPSATMIPGWGRPHVAIAVVVERPGGAFGVVMIHPPSPRTPRFWQDGNALVESTAAVVRRMREQGLPVILLADLNSTPSGLRNRILRRDAGLLRCKPLLRMQGTFPVSWRWPARIAIDDALVSEDVRVTAWEAVQPVGSEHMAVVVDLIVPRGAPNGEPAPEDPYTTRGLLDRPTAAPAVPPAGG